MQAPEPLPLGDDISQVYVDCTAAVGLEFFTLQCGRETSNASPGANERKKLVLLLHGFPELAYSWRKVMPAIAHAGYHVVAYDQRGYGRTTGWAKASYADTKLEDYSLTSLATDAVSLVYSLGYREVHGLIGHDAGAAVAATCALLRPDLFKSCVLISHPFKGIPLSDKLVRRNAAPASETRDPDIETSLAQLDPPRKPYKWYNAKPSAAHEWEHPSQGMSAFLRGYFHLKSAVSTSSANRPGRLESWTASELAKMPNYYVMPYECTMPETVERDMVKESNPAATQDWLPDDELGVYVEEWSRTGFQAALNFYRVATSKIQPAALAPYMGAKITVPCMFLAGDKDWGTYQDPGALEKMKDGKSCADFRGFIKIPRAGHWPQQESAGALVNTILNFLWRYNKPTSPASAGFPSATRSHRQPPSTPPTNIALRSAPIQSGYDPSRKSSNRSPSIKTPSADRHTEEFGLPGKFVSVPPFSADMQGSFHASHAKGDRSFSSAKASRPTRSNRYETIARQDTPIVGPKNPWNDVPAPRASTRHSSSGTETETSSQTPSEANLESERKSELPSAAAEPVQDT